MDAPDNSGTADTSLPARKPEWLRRQLVSSPEYRAVADAIREGGLHTVCSEARCPNLHECWAQRKTATFMLFGDTCTRRCRFCNVKTGLPGAPDPLEPAKVARAAQRMGLRHVVVTMVTRDDLDDGGAALVAATVTALRSLVPEARVELLVSDFAGNPDALAAVLASRPDIMGHNLETVRRLSRSVRSRSDHDRSLAFLRACADWRDTHPAPEGRRALRVKSSLMLGLGETDDEVKGALQEMQDAGVDMVNLGQYLQPSAHHIPVQRYRTPDEFATLGAFARSLGFSRVESGPLVRSSYHAEEQAD